VLPESRTTQRVRSQRQIQCSQQKLAGCRTKPAGEIHTAAHDGPRPLPTSAFVPVPARRRTEGRARARSDTVHGGAAVRTGWCCRARAASLRRAMRRRSTSIQSRYRGTCLHYPILSVSVWVADHRSTSPTVRRQTRDLFQVLSYGKAKGHAPKVFVLQQRVRKSRAAASLC
jgi:hypothetical protein